MYDELKRLLIEKGILPLQIAFVHDATTEAKRNTLFKMMRNGDIRVLIGSTFKLGIGVNVQDKLDAIHHLDVPWRPADMTQREGRILRQGNQNPKLQIFRYITREALMRIRGNFKQSRDLLQACCQARTQSVKVVMLRIPF